MAGELGDAVRALGIDVVESAVPTPSERAIEAVVRAEGLSPHGWGNEAGCSYARHVHGYHKVLFCVAGSIVFHTDGGDVALAPGDRMELPAGVGHGATVGAAGVRCVEAYRA
jgi:quercetin dioxygenase-like cupin family protein